MKLWTVVKRARCENMLWNSLSGDHTNDNKINKKRRELCLLDKHDGFFYSWEKSEKWKKDGEFGNL